MANRASVRDPQVIRFVIDSDGTAGTGTPPTYTSLLDFEIINVTVVSTTAQACALTLLRDADTVTVVNTAGPVDGSLGQWTAVNTTAARVYLTAGQVLKAQTGAALSRCEVWVTMLPGLTASL